jgi:Zn-finger nucleic acid-binding protein
MLCGSEGPAGSPCSTCTVARPVPSATPPLHGARCPRCDVGTLAIAPDPACVVHACPRCHGLFVPPLAWDFLLTHPARVAELEAKLPPAPPDRAALFECVRCPACSVEMERIQFAGTSEIVLDTCVASHGSWLDGGELGAVVRFLDTRVARAGADAGGRRVGDVAEFRERMMIAAEELRSSSRIAVALAGPPPVPMRQEPMSKALGIAAFIGFFVLSGAKLVSSCSSRHAPSDPVNPAQRTIERAASSAERDLR